MIDTIPLLLREAARRFGGKAALLAPDIAPVSFIDLDALADQLAKALIVDGMTAGERIGIWAPNSCEWIAAAVGAQRAGGVIIPLYARLRGMEVADIVARTRARYIVCTAELAELLGTEDLPYLRRIVIVQSGGTALKERQVDWRDFLARGRELPPAALNEREAGLTGDSISDIMFTSGTTGRPKGAVFSHRSSVLAARIMQQYNGATQVDRFYPMGTFAHVGGYKQGWLTGLASGATICWGNPIDLKSTLDLVSQLGITIMPAPPITWQGMLDHPRRRKYDISSLRFAATGGTMIPTELVQRLVSEMRIAQVGTGYGLTENCGLCTYTLPETPVEKVTGTDGVAAPDTEIRIVDADERALGPGQAGEVLIRSPRLLIEYLDDSAATRAALTRDGWLRTGDVGRLDTDGYLKIVDRLKDMYIINGLNVYPAEIERLIETIEGVAQCAVIGLPDARKGEIGAAFIVRSPGSSLSESDVIEWCKRSVAGYKVPASVTFVDDLPRNTMGKVLKTELRTMGA